MSQNPPSLSLAVVELVVFQNCFALVWANDLSPLMAWSPLDCVALLANSSGFYNVDHAQTLLQAINAPTDNKEVCTSFEYLILRCNEGRYAVSNSLALASWLDNSGCILLIHFIWTSSCLEKGDFPAPNGVDLTLRGSLAEWIGATARVVGVPGKSTYRTVETTDGTSFPSGDAHSSGMEGKGDQSWSRICQGQRRIRAEARIRCEV